MLDYDHNAVITKFSKEQLKRLRSDERNISHLFDVHAVFYTPRDKAYL